MPRMLLQHLGSTQQHLHRLVGSRLILLFPFGLTTAQALSTKLSCLQRTLAMCCFLLMSELVETLEVSEMSNTLSVLRLKEPGTPLSEPFFTVAGPSIVSYLSCVPFYKQAPVAGPVAWCGSGGSFGTSICLLDPMASHACVTINTERGKYP